MEPSSPTLEGARVRLRPWRLSDKGERFSLGRDPEFVRLNGGDPRDASPFTPEEIERWFEAVTRQAPLGWAIEHEGRLIGTTRLHNVDWMNRSAWFAIGIFHPRNRGQRLGAEATRLVLEYAFDVLELHRVALRVLEFNEHAIRTYERTGFVREGIERESALIAGEWHSDVVMSILEHEYAQLRQDHR